MATVEQQKPGYSEPDYAKKVVERKKLPFYHENIEHKIPAELRVFLEKYSHVPREQQLEHVHTIRDRAFDIRAYPCTGLGSWLVPQLCRLPIYPEVLQKVKDGAVLVDVGTFIGHDLRRLVYDGAPSEKLYGVDIVSHFDVGYDFFRDRDQFKGHFIEADFLTDESAELTMLKGKVDIVVISQVLHQWDWENQVKAAQVLTMFTKPGSLVVGNQIGNLDAKQVPAPQNGKVWWHNPDSFAKMWQQIGELTGTKWEIQAWLRTFAEMGWDPKDAAWMEPSVRLMEFTAKRIS